MVYSNSFTDQTASRENFKKDEQNVTSFYEFSPYPDLGANLKDPKPAFAPILETLAKKKQINYLEAGCGTGHMLVGVAKSFPQWRCHGVDLSQPSLEIAARLSTMHGTEVTLHNGSYLDKLPFEGIKFDLISAQGTLHHCADPVAALKNLANHLNDDGFISLHMYGLRLDREKFEIKEILDIMEPDIEQIERRFALYKNLMTQKNKLTLKKILSISPLSILRFLKNFLRDIKRKSRRISWSPPWNATYDKISSPWVDHFCHPCERAYEVPEIISLVESSNLKIIHMLGEGREQMDLLPGGWKGKFGKLPQTDKYRLMELLCPGASSFRMILCKSGNEIFAASH